MEIKNESPTAVKSLNKIELAEWELRNSPGICTLSNFLNAYGIKWTSLQPEQLKQIDRIIFGIFKLGLIDLIQILKIVNYKKDELWGAK